MKAAVSIILCTRDRADMLPGCLDALAQQGAAPPEAEVLVVNNASRDATMGVLRAEAERGRLPLRVVEEPSPGVSYARNTGIERAQADFLIFLDDDAVPAPGWLAAYLRLAAEGRRALVQGRIFVQFDGPRPAWLSNALLPTLSHLDEGDRLGPLKGNLVGANFGVARGLIERIGAFRVDLGPGRAGFGEDTEFGLRAAAAGSPAWYDPDALASHRIPVGRLTRRAFLRRSYRAGLSQALYHWYGDPTAWTLLALGKVALVRASSALFTLNGERRMQELGRVAGYAGRMRQILRMRRGRTNQLGE